MTPYRVLVFESRYVYVRSIKGRGPEARGACSVVEKRAQGYVAFTEDITAEPWRYGRGSFLFAGGLKAVARARQALQAPCTDQVQIRTNQDLTVITLRRKV